MENILSMKTTNHEAIYKYIAYFSILIIGLRYFTTVESFALNLPYQDDYHAILKFLLEYKEAHGINKIGLLFSQHNEHRIFHARLIYVLQYAITGAVNFRTLIFIGNAQLIVILCLGISFIRKFFQDSWYVAAFIYALCLFDLSNFENSNWAMAGMSNYGIIMFFFLSLFLLESGKGVYILASIPIQLICIFSNGNGQIACFMLIIYSMADRNRLKIIACVATWLLGVFLYYLHYVPQNGAFTSTDMSRITQYFFHLLGGHFGYEMGIFAGSVILVILLSAFPVSSRFQLKKGVIPLVTILFFILATISVISVFRSNDKILNSYSSRFLIYSNLLAAIAFCFLMLKCKPGRGRAIASFIGVAVLLYFYDRNFDYGIGNLELQQRRLTHYEFYFFKRDEEARLITEKACKEEIYCIRDNR